MMVGSPAARFVKATPLHQGRGEGEGAAVPDDAVPDDVATGSVILRRLWESQI
jgi:hypothetical protein